MRLRVLQNFGADAVWTNITGSWAVLHDVVYNDSLDLWCVVGDSKTILTSPDGSAWTTRTAPAGGSTSYVRVRVGESLFVAGRSNSGDYSADGVTWTARSLGQATAPDVAKGLVYSPPLDRWLAIGQTNAEQSYTSDATTSPWTNVFGNLSAGDIIWDSVNSLYVIAHRNGSGVVTSNDGISNFDPCTQPGTTSGANLSDAIGWDGASTYIVVLGPAITGASNMWRNTSGDPLNGLWSDVTHPFGSSRITSIAYSPEQARWRACSHGGKVAFSDDGGASWTLETVPSATNLFGINWSSELLQWITVGQLGTSPAVGVIFLLS